MVYIIWLHRKFFSVPLLGDKEKFVKELQAEMTSEWYNSQKKPSSNFRKLLQERIDKGNPRRKLVKDETTKLAKLEGIVEKLKRSENVQNCQLQTWLSQDE